MTPFSKRREISSRPTRAWKFPRSSSAREITAQPLNLGTDGLKRAGCPPQEWKHTGAAVEAASERSFMSALNERECARSSERQRLNGANAAAEVHQGYTRLHSVTLTTCLFVRVNSRETFVRSR